MTIDLPAAIATYFSADRAHDAQSVADCFTDNAVVIDERRTYRGRDEIREWMNGASTQYYYTVEPFSLTKDGTRTVVAARLDGTFPGSPVDLRYAFVLDGEKIAELEIAP